MRRMQERLFKLTASGLQPKSAPWHCSSKKCMEATLSSAPTLINPTLRGLREQIKGQHVHPPSALRTSTGAKTCGRDGQARRA